MQNWEAMVGYTGDKPRPGEQLGQYILGDEIGRGASGVVFKARQINLGRDVAVKVLRRGPLADDIEHSRLRREAVAVARLSHPRIVPVIEIGSDNGWSFLVLGLITGRSLEEQLLLELPEPRKAARWIRDAADALIHAHTRGVIHRDLKPANLLLDDLGDIHVSDFGLAKLMDVHGSLSGPFDLPGTLAYLSPEQAGVGSHPVDGRSDLHALGAILYRMLAGTLPFHGDTPAEVLSAVMTRIPEPPRRIRNGIPADLDAICMRCLAKRPADRYPDANGLARDLDQFLGRGKTATPSLRGSSSKWEKRQIKWVTVLAVFAGIAVLVMALNKADRSTRTQNSDKTTPNPGLSIPSAKDFLRRSEIKAGTQTVVSWGQPDTRQIYPPNSLVDLVAIASGTTHSLGLLANNRVIGWGSSPQGALEIPANLGKVVQVAAGNGFSLAVSADGRLAAWGRGAAGTRQDLKTMIVGRVLSVAAGQDHALAILQDRTVVAWGRNDQGQAQVPPGLTNVCAIAAGRYHSLALRSDGTVVAWGKVPFSQLQPPAGLSNVVALASWWEHSLALKDDGTVVGWGRNDFGQASVPEALDRVVAIACGGFHSLALRDDGTVVAWGGSDFTEATIPSGVRPVRIISAGERFTTLVQVTPETLPLLRRPVRIGGQPTLNWGTPSLQHADGRTLHGIPLPGSGGLEAIEPPIQFSGPAPEARDFQPRHAAVESGASQEWLWLGWIRDSYHVPL